MLWGRVAVSLLQEVVKLDEAEVLNLSSRWWSTVKRRDGALETRSGATAKRDMWWLNFLPFRPLCNARRAPGEARTYGALLLLHAQELGEQRETGIVTCKENSVHNAVHNFPWRPPCSVHTHRS